MPGEGITGTYKVRKPSGDVVEVNRFDLNLAYYGDLNRYMGALRAMGQRRVP